VAALTDGVEQLHRLCAAWVARWERGVLSNA
jgi:hypothetical protein